MSAFPRPLLDARLLRRYRRFLADVRFPDGRTETVHCPNPGAMTGCCEPGRPVLVSDRGEGRRKLRYTWELIRMGRSWVCVNTMVANRVVREWLEAGRLLPGYDRVRAEVRCGECRFDFELGCGECLVEVKTVSLARGGVAAFPDAPTERGRRHLAALERQRRRGRRCVLLFFVARGDARAVRPADEIDPAYGRALRRAAAAGVEVLAVRARISRRGITMGPVLPLRL
ncbi:MAG: DNA/RNA nuclease SfsA [Planctomycetota bacterium]